MARHTVGDRRGSVRGAPPDIYVAFGSYGDEDLLAEAFRPVLRFFGFLFKGIFLVIIALFLSVVWYALTAPTIEP